LGFWGFGVIGMYSSEMTPKSRNCDYTSNDTEITPIPAILLAGWPKMTPNAVNDSSNLEK
jgi:hypothetical protein